MKTLVSFKREKNEPIVKINVKPAKSDLLNMVRKLIR